MTKGSALVKSSQWQVILLSRESKQKGEVAGPPLSVIKKNKKKADGQLKI
jgi:hypothetical protein